MIKTLSNCVCKTHKTERFCALVDQNIILCVETLGDGSEQRTCQYFKDCDKNNKCRYSKSNYSPADIIAETSSAN